jgi:hypothetical protein
VGNPFGPKWGILLSQTQKKWGILSVPDTMHILHEWDKAFSNNSEIFPDSRMRELVKELSKRYGDKLYHKGPLGYDESQALIVFPHNTPNNTLPIIWASHRNEKTIGVPWNPLFERIKNTTSIIVY